MPVSSTDWSERNFFDRIASIDNRLVALTTRIDIAERETGSWRARMEQHLDKLRDELGVVRGAVERLAGESDKKPKGEAANGLFISWKWLFGFGAALAGVLWALIQRAGIIPPP